MSNIMSATKGSTYPIWYPDDKTIAHANITQALTMLSCKNYSELWQYSTDHLSDFIDYFIKLKKIPFAKPYSAVLDTSSATHPIWFKNSKLNITDSCLTAPDEKLAIIEGDENGSLQTYSYGELKLLIKQITGNLKRLQIKSGDAIAIAMPMTVLAVAAYLAIIKIGAKVIAIADSLATEEIATRLKIIKPKLIITQDYIQRTNKHLPLYEKFIAAQAPSLLVITTQNNITLRKKDLTWEDFLKPVAKETISHKTFPQATTAILFSSGTTNIPKAIPWDHTKGLKCALDGFFHQDIHPNDRICWPTNLGWMMGHWLIYAAFINQASIALFNGSPLSEAFGKFIEQTKVSILGVVPSMVKIWHATKCMEKFDWSSIRLFSSTGESSNPYDIEYLMSLASHKPVIEYCGGTEIGGAYITSTVVQPNIPSCFSTPALGNRFAVLDENFNLSNRGEVFLCPPALGLSTTLLNKDHFEVYYQGLPTGPQHELLRRHVDCLEKLGNGYYRALGRNDDNMKLGGIKTSSAEIEKVLHDLNLFQEVAAIGVTPPDNGPTLLVIFAVILNNKLSVIELKEIIQQTIKNKLNPLFKAHDLKLVDELPKTASNKIIRKELKNIYDKM